MMTLQEILDRLRELETSSMNAYYQIPETEENEEARSSSDMVRYEINNLIEEVEKINNQGYTIS
jgi:hypothetical protein